MTVAPVVRLSNANTRGGVIMSLRASSLSVLAIVPLAIFAITLFATTTLSVVTITFGAGGLRVPDTSFGSSTLVAEAFPADDRSQAASARSQSVCFMARS